MNALEWCAAVLMISGAALTLVAAVGLSRFADVFARMHAATKPSTAGLALIALGAILLLPGDTKGRLTLVVLFQFVAAPLGAHILSRSSYWTGTEKARSTSPDDLEALDRAEASPEE